jgi:ABC-type transport system involved in multi-copper enzyme maturation permease subunit
VRIASRAAGNLGAGRDVDKHSMAILFFPLAFHHQHLTARLGLRFAQRQARRLGENCSLLGPIFNREWLTVPRRASHYVLRAAYYGLLWVLGLTAWQALVGWSRPATLGDNAHFGLFLFHVFTLVQLVLLLFFAALTAASAIAQEKDRRTFVLLLMTDLRSYEIVLGKLLGSLLQIVLLLIGMVPVLALLLLLGGIAPAQVGQAGLVIAATALAAGSLGTVVALWREKTFQVLALTVLFLVLYLCVVQALPAAAGWLAGSPSAGTAAETWQQWLGPYQALQSVLESAGELETGLTPAYGFALVMVGFSVLLNVWGILRLRVWNPSGEPIMQREQPQGEEEKDRAKAHAAPGMARQVWANPILWREMRTRAYGRRPLLVKLSYFLVLGLICAYALAPLWASAHPGPFAAAYGLVPVGILSFLLISAQAVTAITSERDTGALDLLLVTDLTPNEFIFGKLWGILYNTKEYLLPPLILAVVYAVYGLLASPPAAHPELTDTRTPRRRCASSAGRWCYWPSPRCWASTSPCGRSRAGWPSSTRSARSSSCRSARWCASISLSSTAASSISGRVLSCLSRPASADCCGCCAATGRRRRWCWPAGCAPSPSCTRS